MSDWQHDSSIDWSWVGKFDEFEREAQQLRRSVQDTVGVAESPDGLIEAKAGVYGEVHELYLDARALREPDAAALAEQIRDTINAAGRDAQDQVRGGMPKYVAPDDDDPAELAFGSFLGLLGKAAKETRR
ncbi:YbaB/EbfC family nucleoid-associated protein [Kribbella sandramycini]|uniref:DNA-binding protein YbaB n=1 Tax=Kribbella sandramycini TaxID=60450 RepID=A0A7Y4L4J2_9ACTN|nr:YbaB/EbfC family nucleoid-associated protein [Kribbella sandramycini]MBB6566271.1 DNA-binding protein YbaB [Kribbella sandramycini]NOL43066.1 YbaB/EbfC family nucleoid-associated protein [Kribbella sandramycini]